MCRSLQRAEPTRVVSPGGSLTLNAWLSRAAPRRTDRWGGSLDDGAEEHMQQWEQSHRTDSWCAVPISHIAS
jgi:hypothetical protein